MNKEDLLEYIIQGTRGGASKASNKKKPMAKSKKVVPKKKLMVKKKVMKGKGKGTPKSGYMDHVKKFSKDNPDLTWKECMIAAKSSYIPKGSSRAGARAGARAAAKPNLRKAASRVNRGLKDTQAISKTLRALSFIPTPVSGLANDVSALASALGYGKTKRRVRR